MDGPGREVWNGLEKVGVKPLGGFSTSGFRQLTNKLRGYVARGPRRA